MTKTMTNLEVAKNIVELIGGKNNVVKAANCMTRLRVTVKDASLVKSEELKKTEGVLGLVENGNYIQIVLGPGKAKKIKLKLKELKKKTNLKR